MRKEIGQAHEVNIAMPLTSRKSRVLGVATETSIALPITPRGGSVSIPVAAGAATAAGGTVMPRASSVKQPWTRAEKLALANLLAQALAVLLAVLMLMQSIFNFLS